MASKMAARAFSRCNKAQCAKVIRHYVFVWFGLVWTFDLLVDVIDFRGFLRINVMKSVGKQIEIIKKQ